MSAPPCAWLRASPMLRGMTAPDPAPSLAYLLARLAVTEARVRHAVAARRGGQPHTPDPFRGLYLSDDDVDGLLTRPAPAGPAAEVTDLLNRAEQVADAAESGGTAPALRRLRRTFGLLPLDV